MLKKTLVLAVLAVIVVFPFDAQALLSSDDVPRITIEELKQRMDNHSLVIVDVRIPAEWEEGTTKIKGAVREDPSILESWASKYPPNKTLVFYCA